MKWDEMQIDEGLAGFSGGDWPDVGLGVSCHFWAAVVGARDGKVLQRE